MTKYYRLIAAYSEIHESVLVRMGVSTIKTPLLSETRPISLQKALHFDKETPNCGCIIAGDIMANGHIILGILLNRSTLQILNIDPDKYMKTGKVDDIKYFGRIGDSYNSFDIMVEKQSGSVLVATSTKFFDSNIDKYALGLLDINSGMTNVLEMSNFDALIPRFPSIYSGIVPPINWVKREVSGEYKEFTTKYVPEQMGWVTEELGTEIEASRFDENRSVLDLMWESKTIEHNDFMSIPEKEIDPRTLRM